MSTIFDQKNIYRREQEREWFGGEVDGVLGDYLVVAGQKVVKIPEYLGWEEASCLPCAGLTAWSGLAMNGELVMGRTVLIEGAGGVSLMALKLPLTAGCKVIITSSSDEKLDRIRKLLRVKIF